jgi:hypothetical protein
MFIPGSKKALSISYRLLLWVEEGGAVGLTDRLTCPTIWLPVGCEYQAGMDGFSQANSNPIGLRNA